MAKDNQDDWQDIPLETVSEADDWEDLSLEPQEQVSEVNLEREGGPSQLEALGRGATQGLTLGFAEEAGAAALTPLETLRRKISSLIPGTPENIDEQLKEQGFELPEEKGIYEELRDVAREANKEAEEAYPATYFAGDIAGGVLPAIATGGGAAAAKIGASVGKEGLKQAAKEGAKLGAKYGAVSGVGYGEAEDLGGMAQEAALGGTLGAVTGGALPAVAQGVKSGTSKSLEGLKRGIESIIPESEAIKAGYKYGKEGKKLTQEIVDEDMKSLAASILNKIKEAKSATNLQDIQKQLDEVGIKVDTKEAFESAIDDMEKILRDDILEVSDKSILPKLQKLAGIDTEALKMTQKAEKAALKKALEAQGRDKQAIIKAEKKLAEIQEKGNYEVTNIDDLVKMVDDLGDVETPRGELLGRQATFEPADEGEKFTKKILSDVTPYQPEIRSTIGPDGRPIVTTEDLGSGKITALVGDLSNKVEKDLANMSISEVETVRRQINMLTDLAGQQGTQRDPIIRRAKDLAVKLKELTDKAVEQAPDTADLVSSRKKMSDLLRAEELLGVNKTKAVEGESKVREQVRKLVEKLGFVKGFSSRDEAQEAIEKLGSDVISEADKTRFDMFKQLNQIMGRESEENISRAGLYKKAVGDLPNIAGRAMNRAERLTSPVIDAKKAITELTDEQLMSFGNRLVNSENKGLQTVGQRFLDAANLEGTAKNQLLWSLSQSPAMRQLIQREAEESSELEAKMLEEPQEENITPSQEISAPEQGITREPSSVQEDLSSLKQKEGYAGLLKKETDYSGLTGTPNSKVKGSSEYGLYYDSEGVLTSGIGHKVTSEEEAKSHMNMTKEEADSLLESDNQSHDKDADTVMEKMGIDKTNLSETQIKAIQDMVFQMGMTNALKFEKTLGLVAEGKYDEAAKEVKKSKWYKQTPKRVEDFSSRIVQSKEPSQQSSVDLNSILKSYADQPIESAPEADIQGIERSIDQINQQQSSGDETPVDPLDELLGRLEALNLPEEDIKDLQDDAANMITYSQGLELKEKIKKLMGA